MEAVYVVPEHRLVCVNLLIDNHTPEDGSKKQQLIDQLFQPEASKQWVNYVAQLNQLSLDDANNLMHAMIIYFTDLPSQDGQPFLWLNIPEASRQELVNSCLTCGQWRFLSNGDTPHQFYMRNTVNGNTLLCHQEIIPAGSIVEQDIAEMKSVLTTCHGCHLMVPITMIKFFPWIADGSSLCVDCCENEATLIAPGSKPITACKSCLQFNVDDGKPQCKECFNAGKPINHLSTSDYSLVEMKTKIKSCQGYGGKHSDNCKPIFYAEEDWKKQCIECYKAYKNAQQSVAGAQGVGQPIAKEGLPPNAKCNYCLSDFHAAQDWMKTCRNCYANYKKQCSGCGKFYLPKGNYQTVCVSCYRAGKTMNNLFN